MNKSGQDIVDFMKNTYNFEESKWVEKDEDGICHWNLTKRIDGLSGCEGELEYHPYSGNLYIWSGQGMCSATEDSSRAEDVMDAEGDYAFRVFITCEEQLVEILSGLGIPKQ